MESKKPDLSAGMMKKSPFKHVGYDANDGLPIYDRTAKRAKPDPAPSAGVDAKEDAAETSQVPSPAEPAHPAASSTLQPAKPGLSKGQSVQMADGRRAQVAHVVADRPLARVKTEDGKSMNVKQEDLTPVMAHTRENGAVKVAAHVRGAGPADEQDIKLMPAGRKQP